MEKNKLKVTAVINEDCAHNLKILAAFMKVNSSEAMAFVLEKYVSGTLDKFINKKMKEENNNDSNQI